MRIIARSYASLMLALALASMTFAQISPGSAPSSPASTGTTLSDIIECGEGYTSHELYDMKITLLEVIRGEEAWKRIQAADSANRPADAGMDYLLARVRFEYRARSAPGTCVHQLAPEQFTAYSASGEDYRAVAAVPPKPGLKKGMRSGESIEGWLAFAVARDDKAPLMLFSAGDGGAVQHSAGKWFLLK